MSRPLQGCPPVSASLSICHCLGEQIKWNRIAGFALIVVAAVLIFLE